MDGATGRHRHLGSRVEALLGLPLKTWLEQPFWAAVVHPDDQAAFQRFCQSRGLSHSGQQMELRLRARDGEVRWAKVLAGPDRAQPDVVMGFLFDIHAHHRAEEDRSRFFRMTRDLLAVWDGQGRFQDVNPAWETQMGLPREALIASSLLDHVHPEDRTETQAALDRLLAGDQELVAFEGRFRTRQGDHRWLLWSATPLRDQGLAYGIARDITERKEMELQLRASEERYRFTLAALESGVEALNHSERELRSILDTLPDMLIRMDAGGTFLGFRPSPLFPPAVPPESVLGHTLAEHFPDLAGPALAAIQRCLQEGEPQSLRYELTDATGTLRHFEARLIPHREDEVLAIVRDISDLQRREAAIQEALLEKELLLKEIHHRVKNNLQVVSSLLRLQAHAHKDPRVQGALQEAQERIQAIALIHQKLKQAPDPTCLDLAAYIQTLVERLVRSYAANPTLVDLQVRVDSLRLGPDEAVPLGLVINELVTNALQHAFPPGEGGTLEIELTTLPEGGAELRIADSGQGLPEGVDLDHGGLGFQLVKALADQLGGSLELERRRGAAFSLRFTPRPGDPHHES